jgi:PHD/YefM family antitoxin component YafN of YafNO toxin-antitoxin module
MDQDPVPDHFWLFDTAASLGRWFRRGAAMRTLVAMAAIPLGEAASRLPELVHDVCNRKTRVTVMIAGRPSVVLIAVDDLLALEDTLAVLSDADTMRRMAESDQQLARGEGESEQQLAAAMGQRRSRA